MKLITIIDKYTATLYRQITINIEHISMVTTWVDKTNNDSKSCKIYFRYDQYLDLKGEAAEKFLAAYNVAINGVVDKNLTIWQKMKIFCSGWLQSLKVKNVSTKG